MVISKGVPLLMSPKGSTWHRPQFGDYGSEQHARMWQALLTLLNWCHGKNSGRAPKCLPEFIEEGVKDMPLRKRRTQQKLVTSMGVSKPQFIIGLLHQSFVFIVTH